MANLYCCRRYILAITAVLFWISNVSANQIIPNYDFEDYKIIEHKQDLKLQCNYSLESSAISQVQWLKNDAVLHTESTDKIASAEHSFVIRHATNTDCGNYTCVVTIKNGTSSNELKAVFQVISKPYLKLVPNHSVVEGEKLTIPCAVTSTPMSEVSWQIGNKTYTESTDRYKLLTNPDKNVPKALLQVDEADMGDRGVYTCIASNIASKIFNATEASTTVRVKDKLAALWPFLGICVEVIVLCTIILIYEKKRNKTELDESDTDGSPEQKNTPDHGKDSDVRQRK